MTQTEVLALVQSLVEKQSTKPTLKDKLMSRKFWVSAAGCVCGICGMIGTNANTSAIIAFAVVEIASILIYCICEGSVDGARVKQLTGAIEILMQMIDGSINAGNYINDNFHINPLESVEETNAKV